MLNQATLDKLHALRLTGMAEAYEKQLEEPEARGLNFEERFGMLVDGHWTWRENQALTRRLKKSKLSSEPCVEDIMLNAGTRTPITSLQYFSDIIEEVSESTPSRSHRVLRHFLEAQSFGFGTEGIQVCPQLPRTATCCILHEMNDITHNAQSA
jgi:hypothetical protein